MCDICEKSGNGLVPSLFGQLSSHTTAERRRRKEGMEEAVFGESEAQPPAQISDNHVTFIGIIHPLFTKHCVLYGGISFFH